MNQKQTLPDEGLQCVFLLLIGISSSDFIPKELRNKLAPFMLIALAVVFLIYFIHRSQYSEQDLEREEYDERSQMIREKANWYSRQVEEWILLGLFAVLSLGFQQYTIGYTLFWILIGRHLLSFTLRWYLSRKY